MNLLIVSVSCVLFYMVSGHPYGDGTSVSKPEPEICAATVSALPPDPNTNCCGVPSETPPKIIPGPQTLIFQYPWLVLIEYMNKDKVHTLCNGALISGKYVLTAAHCVTGTALRTARPENIRLGEYDTSNEGKDCVSVDGDQKECTDGAIRIPIESIIPHPEYDITKNFRNHKNDIALIRMTEMAPYTDFIRPICLPAEDIALKNGPVYLNKASWGITSGDQNRLSLIKLQVKLLFVPLDQCESSYGALNVSLWKGQVCSGVQEGQDFCKGDGGAPLVYENGESNEIAGIVSFGPSGCGNTKYMPTVNTKVYEYISWIKNNIVA